MKMAHMAAFLLLAVGGVNWGLVGLGTLIGGGANWNLVNLAVGSQPMLEAIIYILVGASALYVGFTHKKDCKACMSK